MSQVRGHGKTKGAAQTDARKQADKECSKGWQQEGESCRETAKDVWECDLWFHCKRDETT